MSIPVRRPAGVRRSAARRAARLVAAGGLVLAGCGGDADEPSTAPAGPASTAPSSAPATEATTGSPEGAEGSGSATEAVAAAGVAAQEAGSGAFTLTTDTVAGDVTSSSSGEGVFDSEAGVSQVEVTTEVPGSEAVTLTVRQIGERTFIGGFPGLPAEQWVEATPEDLGLGSGGLDTTDPSQQLALLEQVGEDVEETGPTDLDGVQATGYRGSVDLAAALEASGADGGQAAQQLEALGLTSLPFELYVGEDGLPLRVVTTLDTEVQGTAVTATSTVDYTGWGQDVTVEEPTDTVPLEAVAGGQAPATTG